MFDIVLHVCVQLFVGLKTAREKAKVIEGLGVLCEVLVAAVLVHFLTSL